MKRNTFLRIILTNMRHIRKSGTVRIALLLERQLGYCRGVLTGIKRFALRHPDWIFREGLVDARSLPWLREWKPHGIIGHVYRRDVYASLSRLKVPLILTTRTLHGIATPDVDVDHFAVGRMAAEYFLRKGFRNFGYLGSGQALFSLERERGFRETLQGHGFVLGVCHMEYLPMPSFDLNWWRLDKAVERWLHKSPRPLALFTANDIPGRLLTEACQRLELSVPDAIAILGVDNDEYECDLSSPPLSSIAIPTEQIGFTAVKMLAQLLQGDPPRNLHPALPPLYVVSRQSTDHFATNDPVVRRALQFIKENVTQPMTVKNLWQHCAVSRRILERRFQSVLQQTPLQAIHRARVELAKPLLKNTRLDMNTIAGQCGFASTRLMTAIFKKRTDQSPALYRKNLFVG